MSDTKETKKAPKESLKTSARSFFVTLVIAIIIITFIFTGGPMLGMNDFIRDIGKTKIKNEDGSTTIPQDAQVAQNSNNPNAYIGKVLNQKIQLGKRDDFNYRIQSIFNAKADPFTKYQYARMAFEQSINKIIGMKKAREMDLLISKDLLIKEVGKRYYADSEGEPDYIAMRKDPGKVNEYAKETQENLLFENFENDTFSGLPLSKDEILDSYKIENSKVSLKFVNISNKEVSEEKLKQYYETNTDKYKLYKLTRLVFKDKKDAEKALADIGNDSKKFSDLGNKLKAEDKVVNIVYDPVFAFLDNFENDGLRNAVKGLNKGDIGKTVEETDVGPIVFKLEDFDPGTYTNDRVQLKVKEDYIKNNANEVNDLSKKAAMDFYNEAKITNIEKAAEKFKLKVQSMPQPASFMKYGFPYINPDATEDANYIVTVFKSNKGDLVEPFKHESGYLISMVTDKINVNMTDFDSLYDDLYKSYSKDKSNNISRDYYSKEKRRYEVIDNFSYVFKIQDFMPKEEK